MGIRLNRFNEEVYFAADPIVKVGHEDIELLKRLALETKRRRVRLCTHGNVEDRLHEMLIVHTRDAYVRPHKHLNKAESFHIIEGVVDVVFFDDAGAITDMVHISTASDDRFYYRVSGPRFHTLLIRSDFLVFHEVTSGPFIRDQTTFAPWAPEEDDTIGQVKFLKRLNDSVGSFILARHGQGQG
ncbi:MAG TPA: WbuC family cupin fold metalloprotein [Candidatus Tectomicrobia bacterium]